MHRTRRRRAQRLVASALLLLPMSGCATSWLTIEIPGFGDVQGIWLWRLSEATGLYEREGRVDISAAYQSPDGEEVDYVESCASGPIGKAHQATLARSASDPTDVTLQLFYMSCDGLGGTYKVSAYDPLGESPLSSTTISF
jgi:hypothetical protein